MKSFFFKLYKNTLLAIRGGDHDYTKGSINKAIFLLSVPMVLEMAMESLFAVVDVFFVSRIGENAVATIGLTETVLMIIYSLAIGISMGATAMVARRVGEKDPEKATEAAVQSIVLAGSLSILLGILGLIFAEDILRLMGGEEDLIAEGVMYTRLMLAGNITIMLLFLFNAIFRGAGDASIAMRSLWIANGCNIILDPCFIFGFGFFPELGVFGAAVATNIGRGIGVAYQVYNLLKGNGVIKILWRHLEILPDIILRLFKVSLGGVAQFLIASASWIFLVRIIAQFGSDALAGYTIAIRVIIFTILPSWGIANAAATLVGQNLGAGFPDRAEKSVWRSAKYNMFFLLSVSIAFFILAPQILQFFSENEAVILHGSACLRIICLGYVFFAYGMVISQSFNGAGDTKTPTIINFFCFWLLQIPLAYCLSILMDWGTDGVFWAVAISESILAMVAIYVFKLGRWKKMVI